MILITGSDALRALMCCGYGAHNSPLLQPEIDAHCEGQTSATTAVQRYLLSRGGWEAQKCFDYKPGHESDVDEEFQAD